MRHLSLLLGGLLAPLMAFSQVNFQEFPKSLQLYPRDIATNQAKIQIIGTADSSPDSLIFTLTKSDGVVERKAISMNGLNNNTFEQNFNLTAGLWSYVFKTERKTPSGLVLLKNAENIVAGDVIAVQGQSNAQAVAYDGNANIWQSNFIRCFGTSNPDLYADENWYIAEGNGYFSPGAVGQWALRMGYLIQQDLQIPVAIINGADPGKPIEFFQRNDVLPIDPSTNYGRLLQRLTNAGVRENIRAMMYYQGESDGDRAEIHKTLFEALHADWEEDFPGIEACFVVQVREGCGAPSLQLREYQRAFEDYLPKTKAVATNGINGHDGCHYSVQGYQTLGEKIYKQLSADLYNAPTGEQLNVRVVSAGFSNNLNTQITVVTDATSALTVDAGSVADFRLSGAGAAVISIHADSNKLILDLDQSVNVPNAGLSYGGHSGSNAWVLNGDGYGMFTFFNLSISGYSVVPNFDIPGIMSGSGNCISLDGSNDCVYIGSVLSSSYTKEAWINWRGGGLGNNIISGATNTAFWMPGGTLAAGHNGAWGQVVDNVTVTPNQWVHVAVSFDSVLAEMRLYKNGNLVSAAQNIPPQINDPQLYIGAYSGAYTFDGKIDEVRVWNKVRTLEEVRSNMCQKLRGNEPSLLAYFRFDETVGGIAPNMTDKPDGQLNNFQGLGLNEAWRRSGAPIGTKSTYTYEDVDEISLAIASGDSLVFSAPYIPDFVHLYFVEEVPNVLEPAEGYVLVDPGIYFGLFYANQSISDYDLKYLYQKNPFASVEEERLGLLRRINNAQSYWGEAPQFQVDPMEHAAIAQGTQFQEYILAIRDSVAIGPLTAQLVLVQSILCNGVNNAVLQVSAQGGQAPYNYYLNGGAPQQGGIFAGLSPGTYSVQVTDQTGYLVLTNQVTIQSPDPLVVSAQVNQNNVMLTIEGGTAPYLIQSNAPDPNLQNLPNGTYTLGVMDANGCPFNSFFTIDYQPFMATANLLDPNPCDGVANLIIVAQGGTPPYQYSLDNSAFQAGNTFDDLFSGNYTLMVQDNNSQMLELNAVEINIPSQLNIVIEAIGESITIAPMGGTSPYSFSLNGGSPQADSVFSNLLPGDYTIEITDVLGCSIGGSAVILTNPVITPVQAFYYSVNPNPGTGLFELIVSNTNSVIYGSITDVTGKALQSFEIQPFENAGRLKIDLSEFASGIYFLQITDGHSYQNLRLVKM
jgi:hypothetical protein